MRSPGAYQHGDGMVVSASLFTRFNNLVYNNLSGHSHEAFEMQAPTLLLWEIIKRCRKEGARPFNLGGCKIGAVKEESPVHGVYVYKKVFGGNCLECGDARKILRRTTHRITTFVRSISYR